MIPEIVLAIVIVALLALQGVSQYYYAKEREKLLKMIMAKNLTEVTDNERVEKIVPIDEKPPEFIPVNPDNAEEFDDAIKKVLGIS